MGGTGTGWDAPGSAVAPSAPSAPGAGSGTGWEAPGGAVPTAKASGGGGFMHDLGSVGHFVSSRLATGGSTVKSIGTGLYTAGKVGVAEPWWNLITTGHPYAHGTGSAIDKQTDAVLGGALQGPMNALTDIATGKFKDPIGDFIMLLPAAHGVARTGLGAADATAALRAGKGVKGAASAFKSPGLLSTPRLVGEPGRDPVSLYGSHNAARRLVQAGIDRAVNKALANDRANGLLGHEGPIAAYGKARMGGTIADYARASIRYRQAMIATTRVAGRGVEKFAKQIKAQVADPQLTAQALLHSLHDNVLPEHEAILHEQQAARGVNPEQNTAWAQAFNDAAKLQAVHLNENNRVVINDGHPLTAPLLHADNALAKLGAHAENEIVARGLRDPLELADRRGRVAQLVQRGNPLQGEEPKALTEARRSVGNVQRRLTTAMEREKTFRAKQQARIADAAQRVGGKSVELGNPHREAIVTLGHQLEAAKARVQQLEDRYGYSSPERRTSMQQGIAARERIAEAAHKLFGEHAAQHLAQVEGFARQWARVNDRTPQEWYAQFLRDVDTPAEIGDLPEGALAEIRRFHDFPEERAAGNLAAKLRGAEKGAGMHQNPRIYSSKGHVVVGQVTPQEWVARVTHVIPKMADRAYWADWYNAFEPTFRKVFGKAADELMRAFAVSQANDSPAGGLQASLRIFDDIRRGIPVSDHSYSVVGGSIRDAMKGLPIEKGVAAKLSDFIDALRQADTRTWVGNHELGGEPAPSDVHAARDFGFVDPKILGKLEKEHGISRDQVTVDNPSGSPSGNRYERVAEWYHQITNHLNEIHFDGRDDWKPAEVQALGWAAIQRFHGVEPEDFEAALSRNTKTIAAPATAAEMRRMITDENGFVVKAGKGIVEAVISPEAAARVAQRLADTHGESRVMWLSNLNKARTPLVRINGTLTAAAKQAFADAGYTHFIKQGGETLVRSDGRVAKAAAARIIREHGLDVTFDGKVQEHVYQGAAEGSDRGGAVGEAPAALDQEVAPPGELYQAAWNDHELGEDTPHPLAGAGKASLTDLEGARKLLGDVRHESAVAAKVEHLPVAIHPNEPRAVKLGPPGGGHAETNAPPGWVQATAVLENGRLVRLNFGKYGQEGQISDAPYLYPLDGFQQAARRAVERALAKSESTDAALTHRSSATILGSYSPEHGLMRLSTEHALPETLLHEALHAVRQSLSPTVVEIARRMYAPHGWDRAAEERFVEDMRRAADGEQVSPEAQRLFLMTHQYTPGRGYVPMSVWEDAHQANSPMAASGSQIVGSAKSPITSHRATGAATAQGLRRTDVGEAVTAHVQKLFRYFNTVDHRDLAARYGSDTRMSSDDVLVRYDRRTEAGFKLPAQRVDEAMKEALGILENKTGLPAPEEEGLSAGVSAVLRDFVGDLFPRLGSDPELRRVEETAARGDKAPAGYKWVPEQLARLKDLESAVTRGEPSKMGRFADNVNGGITAATVYYKIGHFFTRYLTNAATNIMQGSAAPWQIARSVQLAHELTDGEMSQALAYAGTHYYEAAPGATGSTVVGRSMQKGVHIPFTDIALRTKSGEGYMSPQFWAHHVDAPFRFNSLAFEARQAGYEGADGFRRLLRDVESYNDLEPHDRARVDGVLRRADREAIAYDRLNQFEKKWLTRIVWFYPWIKGSTVFTGNTILEHPFKAAALYGYGEQGDEERRHALGDLPSYAEGLTPLTGGSEPVVSDFNTFNPFSTAADLAHIPEHLGDTAGLANPFYGAVLNTAEGVNPYGAKTPTPITDNLKGLLSSAPEFQIGNAALDHGDQSHRLYPGGHGLDPLYKNWLGELVRALGSPATPRHVNPQAGHSLAERERKGR